MLGQILADYDETKKFLVAEGIKNPDYAGEFIAGVHKRLHDKTGIIPIPRDFLKAHGIESPLMALVRDKNLIKIGKLVA